MAGCIDQDRDEDHLWLEELIEYNRHVIEPHKLGTGPSQKSIDSGLAIYFISTITMIT